MIWPASRNFAFLLPFCLLLLAGGTLGAAPTSAQPPPPTLARPGLPASGQVPPLGTPPPTPACGPAWRVVYSPHPGTESEFEGVTAVAATDVWAVGGSYHTG